MGAPRTVQAKAPLIRGRRVYGVVGWKNTGKTGLMVRLISEISRRGHSVSTVKHAHHIVGLDPRDGRGSIPVGSAAQQVLVASSTRWALLQDHGERRDIPLENLVARMAPVDLILVEGYKRDQHHKVEAHRVEAGRPLITNDDGTIRAVASNDPALVDARPVFDLDDTGSIAEFVLKQVGLA